MVKWTVLDLKWTSAKNVYVLFTLVSGLTNVVLADITRGDSALTCTFDTDLCGWTQDDTDDFDWTRGKGATLTDGTGPSSDHTSGGHKNKTTRLKSPKIDTDNVCLTFWYHMYGADIGALTVYKREREVESKVFEQKGPREEKWKRALIELQSNVPFQIIIEARVGKSFDEKGDIAIDDINSTSCHLDCAFDGNICAWRNDYGTRNWAFQSEEKDKSIYIFKSANESATAKLKSTMQTHRITCMTIRHRINGSKNNSLGVFIRQNEDNDKLIRSITNSNSQKLETAHIEIDNPEAYMVLLVGSASSGAAENVYIYDITTTGGNCPKDCNSSPCLNGAACKQTTDATYRCECLEGWTGQHCADIVTTTDAPTTAVTETPTSNGSTPSNDEQGGILEDSKSVMTYIVIPVGAGVLVLIVIVVVCLLVLRRNKIRKRRQEGENNIPGESDNTTAMAKRSDQYEVNEVVYEQPDAVNIGGNSKLTSQNESEYSEANYMHTANVPVTKSGEDNIYNHLNQANIEAAIVDQTYSHIPSAKSKVADHDQDSVEDENYDVLETAKSNKNNEKTTQGASVLEDDYDHV